MSGPKTRRTGGGYRKTKDDGNWPEFPAYPFGWKWPTGKKVGGRKWPTPPHRWHKGKEIL